MHCSIAAVDHSNLAVYSFIPAVHCSIPALEHHFSAVARMGGQELAAEFTESPCWDLHLFFFFLTPPPVPLRCSHPKNVANAHIDVGNDTLLNTRLRYTCNPGYKRKAGTSSLIQCILRNGSTKPDWTDTTLQCIRDPALPPLTPSPELPTAPCTKTTTQRAGTTNASPTSSPSPAAMPGLPGAAGWSPTPPAPDGPLPETSIPPKMLETSTPGERMAPGTPLGTTPLPTTPMDHAAVSIQTLASSIGLPVLVVAGVVACCCWRMKTRMGQDYVAATAIPMMAPTAENEEVLPPGVFPTG
ncbi:interleukin-15 receptor subunit alpha [Gavia stellata]|uniref:interleukin-15 receptor subunit alpha n=1 Tax=Gavia stellata TaxID=37040 RepID=UPI0028982633|nr:interleukin-15 receptor subunit alpha [Gavia stellata]